jgi:hypothetical protein
MKQTPIPTAWQAGILQRARRQTENLMTDYEALPAATTPAGVERAAKALLAIVKLARAADDSLPVAENPAEEPAPLPPQHAPNRQERRRLASEARHAPDRLAIGTSP